MEGHQKVGVKTRPQNRTAGSFMNSMKNWDRFATSLPGFNLQGEETVKSRLGAFCSMIAAVVVLLYATVKFVHLTEKHNPGLAAYLIERPSSLQTPFNLNLLNSRIAFAFVGYNERDLKDDPRYVRWIVRHTGKADGERWERILPYHKCTAEDYSTFYPTVKAQEPNLNKIKDSLLCIDWDDKNPYLAYGALSDPDWARLEAILVPCNYIHR